MTQLWRPTATTECLQLRANTYRLIRQFFAERDVLEVDTPLLCQAPVCDPNIEPVAAGERYLHTSPEYAMKRLLCAGSGDIYQLCKVFRQGEAGSRHNPEFTLLEWYRVGWTYSQLMAEVEALLQALLSETIQHTLHLTYAQALANYANLEYATLSAEDIQQYGIQLAGADLQLTTDSWLDLIISHRVEPNLPENTLVFIRDYPASQAALAKVRQGDTHPVAERFEVYLNGMELANGYQELTDAGEQRQRFQQEAQGRRIDENLLSAMEHGLPECAGVAVGIDRVLMLQAGKNDIAGVLSFDWQRA